MTTATRRRLATGAVSALIALAALTVAWFATRTEGTIPPNRVAPMNDRPTLQADAAGVPSPRPAPVDLIGRYMDLRDDVNPVPRLAFLEDAARDADADAAADLFAQAMVDPDERVRTRAQELLDRVMPATRPHAAR